MASLEAKSRKRNTSIITIFLWILLVVVMGTIMIGSVFQGNRLEGERTITLKLDFSDFLNDGTIPEEYADEALESFIDILSLTKNHVYNGQGYTKRYVGREGNIAIYEIDLDLSAVNYMEFYIETNPYVAYEILENGNPLEVAVYDEWDEYYIREITEDQDIYEFKIQKMQFDTTINMKMDFTEIANMEGIPEEAMEEVAYGFLTTMGLTKDHIDYAKYTARCIDVEGYIVSYEVSFNDAEVDYIDFDITDSYYIMGKDNLLGSYIDEDEYVFLMVQEIIEGKESYDFKIGVDFSYAEVSIDISEINDFIPRLYVKQGENFYYETYSYRGNDTNVIYDIAIIPDFDYTFEFALETSELESDILWSVYEGDTLLEFKDDKYFKTVKYDEGSEVYQFKIIAQEKYQNLSQIYSNINWMGKENKEAVLEFGVSKDVFDESGYVVFTEKLADGFTISSEYENASNWLIVNENEIINDSISSNLISFDLENNEYIPEYIHANFFKENTYSYCSCGNIYTDVKLIWKGQYQYIYVKDKNILYGILNYPNSSVKVNLEYIGNVEETILKVNSETKVAYFYDEISDFCGDRAWCDQHLIGSTLGGKSLDLTNSTSASIEVNKVVKNETGNATYYVGLFENEEDNITNKIYQIDTIDGIGSTKVIIDNYDGTKLYYIYEVDEFGNKVSNEALDYSKNKVLENAQIQEEYVVGTDKSIVSMVGTKDPNVVGAGLGEDYYNNNAMNVNYVYQDTVTIAEKYEETVHVVKFEAGEGGRINGETSVVVKDGEKVGTVAKAVANTHYSFDKWVVIEDGVEKEVDPSSYVITKDTTFIANFKKDRYIVKYESSEGGKIEGSLQEVVEYRENPVLVPSVVSDENYEFDKWVIVENGEEIQINPSNYKVEKDVTIIAKFKKIDTIETSDIEVWKYVGIGISSVLVIAIIVVLIVLRKKSKNKNK